MFGQNICFFSVRWLVWNHLCLEDFETQISVWWKMRWSLSCSSSAHCPSCHGHSSAWSEWTSADLLMVLLGVCTQSFVLSTLSTSLFLPLETDACGKCKSLLLLQNDYCTSAWRRLYITYVDLNKGIRTQMGDHHECLFKSHDCRKELWKARPPAGFLSKCGGLLRNTLEGCIVFFSVGWETKPKMLACK